MRNGCLGLVVAMAMGACAMDEYASTQQADTLAATVTTDKTDYTFTQGVTVSWSGMTTPTSSTDWISIAPSGSDDTTVSQWVYTNGAASGSVTFGGSPQPGTYVARAYSNDTYTKEGESAPFTIAAISGGAVTLSAGGTTFHMDDTLTVQFTGMPGNTKDYITIAPVGSSDTTITTYRYTNGGTNGSVTFTNGIAYTGLYRTDNPELTSGQYVFRAYVNDTYTKIFESAPVQIGATITMGASSYPAFGAMTVSWTNMPGNRDWIALEQDGSDFNSKPVWAYTGDATSGTMTFPSGAGVVGKWHARAFTQDTYDYQGESVLFDVTSGSGGGTGQPTITSDATTYAPGATINISWTNAPGNDKDWIDIAPQGSGVTTISRGANGGEDWVYIHSQLMGSFGFSGPSAPGTYVARLFVNDGYQQLVESAPFTVQ